VAEEQRNRRLSSGTRTRKSTPRAVVAVVPSAVETFVAEKMALVGPAQEVSRSNRRNLQGRAVTHVFGGQGGARIRDILDENEKKEKRRIAAAEKARLAACVPLRIPDLLDRSFAYFHVFHRLRLELMTAGWTETEYYFAFQSCSQLGAHFFPIGSTTCTFVGASTMAFTTRPQNFPSRPRRRAPIPHVRWTVISSILLLNTVPAAWATLRTKIAARIVKDDKARLEVQEQARLRERQRACELVIRPYYDSLARQRLGTAKLTFPRFAAFKELDGVKIFWAPDGEDPHPMDDEAWAGQLPAIQQEVVRYRERIRVEVIRRILSATSNVPLATLSTDPLDYDEDTYDSDFFSRPTSHLFSSAQSGYNRTFSSAPYPACLGFNRSPWSWADDEVLDLAECISRRHTIILRAILAAAGLDEETATIKDLHDVGERFRWIEYPVFRKAEATFTWTELVSQLSFVRPCYDSFVTVADVSVTDERDLAARPRNEEVPLSDSYYRCRRTRNATKGRWVGH
jgi:hypothetical protein